QRLAPLPDGLSANTPPVHDGNLRLRADGACQLLVHQQANAAAGFALAAAQRPRDAALRPPLDDHVAVAVQAADDVARLQVWRGIGASEQFDPIGVVHGCIVPLRANSFANDLPPTSPRFPRRRASSTALHVSPGASTMGPDLYFGQRPVRWEC